MSLWGNHQWLVKVDIISCERSQWLPQLDCSGVVARTLLAIAVVFTLGACYCCYRYQCGCWCTRRLWIHRLERTPRRTQNRAEAAGFAAKRR